MLHDRFRFSTASLCRHVPLRLDSTLSCIIPLAFAAFFLDSAFSWTKKGDMRARFPCLRIHIKSDLVFHFPFFAHLFPKSARDSHIAVFCPPQGLSRVRFVGLAAFRQRLGNGVRKTVALPAAQAHHDVDNQARVRSNESACGHATERTHHVHGNQIQR